MEGTFRFEARTNSRRFTRGLAIRGPAPAHAGTASAGCGDVAQEYTGNVAHASTEVVHGAVRLVRAEMKVALGHVADFAVQAALAVALGAFSLVMLQAGLILTVLSPLLFGHLSQTLAILALAVPYVAGICSGILAVTSWRKAASAPRQSISSKIQSRE